MPGPEAFNPHCHAHFPSRMAEDLCPLARSVVVYKKTVLDEVDRSMMVLALIKPQQASRITIVIKIMSFSLCLKQLKN